MPYIKKEDRALFDSVVSQLAAVVKTHGQQQPTGLAGDLNYIITTLLAKVYGKEIKYHQHNEIMGMLECVKQEWYRRRSAPYEDVKIRENGDVE